MNSREASRKSRNTIFRNMQQLFVTCNKIALICCKTGLNVGGKTRNTAFQPTTMHLVYPSPRPQILQNHCFQFLPGYYNRPKRNRRHGYGRKQGVLWSMWKWWIEWYGHPSNLNYFERTIKQLLNATFVGYEEFCRSRSVLCTPAFGLGAQHMHLHNHFISYSASFNNC